MSSGKQAERGPTRSRTAEGQYHLAQTLLLVQDVQSMIEKTHMDTIKDSSPAPTLEGAIVGLTANVEGLSAKIASLDAQISSLQKEFRRIPGRWVMLLGQVVAAVLVIIAAYGLVVVTMFL